MSVGSQVNLSERLRSILREMIVDGELAPDTRINEVHLAARLHLSRTPLREALTALVSEGALTSIPRRGFFVRPLSVAEFSHIYPIRRLLDPEAFRLSGLPGQSRIAELERLNQRIRQEAKVEKRVRLDDAWHLELIAHCPNPVLLDLIRQFMLRSRRYELAFYREQRNVEISTADHDRVIAAVRNEDLELAMKALVDNLTSAIPPMLDWLRRREESAPAYASR